MSKSGVLKWWPTGQMWLPTNYVCPLVSGIATGESRGQSAPLDSKNFAKIGKKREKIRKKWEKEEKSGRFFHLSLLTDRAVYATALSQFQNT